MFLSCAGTNNWCGESSSTGAHPIRDRYKCILGPTCSMQTLPCPTAYTTYTVG